METKKCAASSILAEEQLIAETSDRIERDVDAEIARELGII